ncbi:MAG: DoxX family membrane protein [Chlorobiaceae bacterium]|jgi:thiosulfate dehydrogenase (quinone) large subunit|nr:DoxX family membrane protein [Chlorobiaceae bacterium]NTW74752.1 DoxX family membrane protein [Chlorobiaceae bacterium]
MTRFEWNRGYMTSHPLQTAGVSAALIIRYLYTALFLYGFVHKIMRGWMWTGIMEQHFTKRLAELQVEALVAGSGLAQVLSFQAAYLEHFAIPLALPIAWIVTIGELIVGVALLLGVATRANALFGLFFLLNFTAGGYYNLTIPPLVLMSLMMIFLPTGQWFGLDRMLNRKYPDSPWFR